MKNRVGVGVGVILLRDDKILLGRRSNDPIKADSELHGEGTWTLPGGKLDFGEDFEQAAIREVKEETGINIEKGDLEVISITNDVAHDAHFITIGLLCKKFQGDVRVMEEDIEEWRWFSFDDLPSNLFEPSKKLINNYIDKEFYKH